MSCIFDFVFVVNEIFDFVLSVFCIFRFRSFNMSLSPFPYIVFFFRFGPSPYIVFSIWPIPYIVFFDFSNSVYCISHFRQFRILYFFIPPIPYIVFFNFTLSVYCIFRFRSFRILYFSISLFPYIVFFDLNTDRSTSCRDIQRNTTDAESGIYPIIVGNEVRNVLCDMETEGGDWTARYNFNESCAGQFPSLLHPNFDLICSI